jgi:hypothetical protein
MGVKITAIEEYELGYSGHSWKWKDGSRSYDLWFFRQESDPKMVMYNLSTVPTLAARG